MKTMRSAALTAVCLYAAGCGGGPIVPAGQSFANGQLQSDALRTIKQTEMARELRGEAGVIEYGMPKVMAARVVEPPSSDGTRRWKEVWTIERHGGTVDYAITFVPRPDIGGTDMIVSPLNMPVLNR